MTEATALNEQLHALSKCARETRTELQQARARKWVCTRWWGSSDTGILLNIPPVRLQYRIIKSLKSIKDGILLKKTFP
jgi:hypothetical protein